MSYLVGLSIVAALSAGSLTQAGKPPDAAAKALASIQGTWNVISINGQALADGGTTMSLTFTGNKYVQTVNGTVNERGTISVDPSKKPMHVDLVIVEGDDAGKKQLGTMEVTGDSMTSALSLPGAAERPAGLTGEIVFVAKRSK